MQKDIRQGDELLAGMMEIGLAHEIEDAIKALPAAGIKLVRRSSAQTQLSRDWLHNQLEQLTP